MTQRKSKSGGQMGGKMTGTRDTTFNLISILYHALEGAETYNKYIQDAESDGDRELAQFFQQVKDEELERAERCKEHLTRYLTKSTTQRRAA